MHTISICVHDDIMPSVKWLLKEFDKDCSITTFHSMEILERAFKTDEWDLLILEITATNESIGDSLARIKSQKPRLKIILVVSPTAKREDVMDVIKGKLVQGLVIKPFTGEVMTKYLEKIETEH
jgi:two-component SAPR family response regulator